MNLKGHSLRSAYGLILNDRALRRDFLVSSCDTSTSAGLEKFKRQHSSRYIEFGISEQAAVAAASAIASQGFPVFFSTFAPFLVFRAAEQIKLSVSYDSSPVCLVGLASGIVQSHLGGTHCSMEDLALISSFSNIEIISPCTILDLEVAIDRYLANPKPMYIRLTGDSKILSSTSNSHIDFFDQIKEGKDVAIVFTGSVLVQAEEVSKLLAARNFKPAMFSVASINSENYDSIMRILNPYQRVYFVEEHVRSGSLYSKVADKANFGRFGYIGLAGDYSRLGGKYFEALAEYGLSAERICSRIVDEMHLIC